MTLKHRVGRLEKQTGGNDEALSAALEADRQRLLAHLVRQMPGADMPGWDEAAHIQAIIDDTTPLSEDSRAFCEALQEVIDARDNARRAGARPFRWP